MNTIIATSSSPTPDPGDTGYTTIIGYLFNSRHVTVSSIKGIEWSSAGRGFGDS